MGIVDLEQEFAASILRETLDRLCQRFQWNRDEAWGFLLGSAVAWRVSQLASDARIIEEVKQTLGACRAALPPVVSASKPSA